MARTFIGCIAPDTHIDPAHFEPIIAEPGSPNQPAHASTNGPTCAFPIDVQSGLNASVVRIVNAPFRSVSL